MLEKKITFIGGGNMARSLIGGLIASGANAQFISVAESDADKCQALSEQFGIISSTDNLDMIAQTEVIILAVKPDKMRQVIEQCAELITTQQPLLVSIAAGISVSSILGWLANPSTAVVRCMPNTPALVQAGITGLYANEHTSSAQKSLAQTILDAVGTTIWLEQEQELNAVTAVSGCGPAYFFKVMEAMITAGSNLGLSEEVVRKLTIQTALGAAKMAATSSNSVTKLRQQVTSPGGSTERALQALTAGNIDNLFLQAMTAAYQRAIELDEAAQNRS